MTKCAMTGIEIRCPECGSAKVSLRYHTTYTVLFCQEPECGDRGIAYLLYSSKDERYPEVIKSVPYDIPMDYKLEQGEEKIEKH